MDAANAVEEEQMLLFNLRIKDLPGHRSPVPLFLLLLKCVDYISS